MRDCCSFDGMVTADLDERYENLGGNTTITAAGRNSTNGLHGLSGSSGYDKYSLPNHTIYGIAFSWKQATLASNVAPCRLLDAASAQVGVGIDATGKIFVFRNTAATVLATTAAQVIFAGTQHHIQFMATIHNTTGAYEVRVDGVNVLSATGVNTRNTVNAYANGYAISGSGLGASAFDVDDVYVWDGSGSINTGFPGDVRVFAVLPSGAGTTTQMTPSAGSNFQCVDDASPNATTDFVSETTVGEKDTYAFADIGGTGTVLGAQLSVHAQKSDAGAVRAIAGICRASAVELDGSAVTLANSWRYWISTPYETDPSTSAAWASVAALNGAEFGMKVTT